MFENIATCDAASTKILLLKGGKSGEREISLTSGGEVAKALREEGFEVEEVDTGLDDGLERIISADCDVIFPVLHGKGGEDGTIQGLCELMGKPFVGPGVLASALAMDKSRSKVFYIASGLPTPNSLTLHRDSNVTTDEVIAAVGEKCVVKPATEGSAIGVTIVHSVSELAPALDEAFAHDSAVIVERFVEGVETTVAVLGNNDPVALPVIEIVPGNEFYDFESKYAPGGSQHICPARISDEVAESCKRIAISAHQALGCKGVSRSDMIIDATGTAWILETNTIPGMTPTSLLPDAANSMGISFPKLCHLLVDFALDAS